VELVVSVCLAISLVVALILVRSLYPNRMAPGAGSLIILLLASAGWSLCYWIELSSPTLQEKLFWARVEYAAIITIPLAWFFFSFQYLGTPPEWQHLLRWRWVLAIIPGLTFGLVWSNDLHR
jgi:hypothetical protein